MHPGHRAAERFLPDRVHEILPGKKNQFFIVNNKKNSFDIFDFDNNKIFSIPLTFDVSTDLDDVNSKLFYLNDSLLAITCAISGFYLFDYHSASHQLSLHGGKYFDGRHCTAVFLDREKRFWVGTNNGLFKQNLSNPLLSRLRSGRTVTGSSKLEIRAIVNHGNKLFVGFRNRGGLMMLDKFSHKIEHRFDLAKSDPDCNTVSLYFSLRGDTLWMGTNGGILWLNTRNDHYGPLIFPAEHGLGWRDTVINDHGRHAKKYLDYREEDNTVIRFNRDTRSFTEISETK